MSTTLFLALLPILDQVSRFFLVLVFFFCLTIWLQLTKKLKVANYQCVNWLELNSVYGLVQWNWFSDVTGWMKLKCIQWRQRTNGVYSLKMATDWEVSEVGDTCRPAAGPGRDRSVQIEWISAGTAHLGFPALWSVPHLLLREIKMNRPHFTAPGCTSL